MNTWLLIGLMSFVTFVNRYVFFSKTITYHPGEKFKTFLSFSAQAILTALWVPIVFHWHDAGTISITNTHYLISTLFVLVLSFFRINMLLVVLMGLSLFFALKFLA